MELTPIQKEILTSLVTLYRQKKQAVKGEEIAEMISRNPGTVRNQMQSLKALRLVEGVPGPKGGYKTTSATYEALSIGEYESETTVPLRRNNELIENVTASEISFTAVRHPDLCNGLVRVIGDVRDFDIGDKIQIGPTPVNKLIIRGTVTGRDDTENSIVFSVEEMISLPKKPVKEYIKSKTITIPANANMQEASRILIRHNIHGAPVEDKGTIVGMVTFRDIGESLASGKINVRVRDIMTKEIISIDGNKPLYETVKIFDEKNVGRLLVTSNGKPIGVISKTDILRELTVY
jgi:hypothetical protein